MAANWDMLTEWGNEIRNRNAKDDDGEQAEPVGQPRRQSAARMAFVPVPHAGMQAAGHLINQGFSNHAAAAGKISDAIGNELDSRVAQLREMRRMEHEKEKLRMQIEARNQDREGELIRAILGKTYS
jgi:hypothetical protein